MYRSLVTFAITDAAAIAALRASPSTTAAATRGPASDPRPASSAPATQRQPSERSKRNSREVLERPDLLRGPVGPERLADDPVARDRPPESAVLARATVIAHHEVMIGWNGDLLREIARGSTSAGHDEVLLRALPVDDRVTVLDSQGVAGTGDDPLDEVRVGLFVGRLRARLARGLLHPAPVGPVRPRGGMEDDDVADLRVGEVVDEAVDQHPLVHVERRLHRRGGNLIRLDHEGLNEERQPDRQTDDHDQLEECAVAGFRLADQPAALPDVSLLPAESSAPASGSAGSVAGSGSLSSGSPSASSTFSSGSTVSASLTTTPSESTASGSASLTSSSSSIPQRRSATRARLPTRPRR